MVILERNERDEEVVLIKEMEERARERFRFLPLC